MAGGRSGQPLPARAATGAWLGETLLGRLVLGLALLAGLAAYGVGLWLLILPRLAIGGVERTTVGTTPARVYLPAGGVDGPVVVIAHGFAGSQQLMEPFALALAGVGYRAITFDFPGHGQHVVPLRGGLVDRDARGAQLAGTLDEVVAYARERFGGPVGLLGHSMGSEAVVRYAQAHPEIEATVAVSLVYEGVTTTSPRNLLVLTGALESGLRPLAQAVADAAARGPSVAGRTYGDVADGSARRVVFVPRAEHLGVLFSAVSLEESRAWFQAAMPAESTAASAPPLGSGRLAALGLLYLGAVLLFWPLASVIRPIVRPERGVEPLGLRAWWAVALAPALLTPLLLRLLPTSDLLPILVGGPLAAFFGLYGLLTGLGLLGARLGQLGGEQGRARVGPGRRIAAWWRSLLMATAVALLVVGYVFLAFGLPAQQFLLNYFPPLPRLPVFLAVFAALLPYMLADELLARWPGAPPGAYAITRVCFLGSLALAIALNPGELFFLILIAPLLVAYFVVYGLLSGIVYRRSGTVLCGALANGAIFAWIIATTFPLVR